MTPKEFFEKKYEELISSHTANNYLIIQKHFGPMGTEDDVDALAYQLENSLAELGEKKGVIKRIFSLIIEALQNIRLHGEHDSNGEQLTYYVFAKNEVDQEYVIITSNLIFNKNINRVKPKIDKINSLDRAGLKEYYMETLTDGERSVKGGAGLGFITVAMKSKNKIEYELFDFGNEMSFFQMRTDLITKKDADDE